MPDNQTKPDALERIVEGLVRVGKVTDADNRRHKARVKFDGENMTSGWLYVLNRLQLTVNDIVLVLYPPLFNADGFILGSVN